YRGASAGGPTYYRGRDMALAHRGMRITESDWNVLLGHAAATLAKFRVPETEQSEVVKFVQGLKKDIVEQRSFPGHGGGGDTVITRTLETGSRATLRHVVLHAVVERRGRL